MAGEVFKLEANVTGRPIPSLVWTKEGKELGDTAKLEIRSSDFHTILVNKDSLRRDGGAFTLTASNPGGFAKFTFNVKVLDRPGPPDSLTVSDVTAEKCVLNWLHPTHDGGAKIEYFIIQRRETSRLAWTNVATDLQANRFKVTKLLKGNEYIFRVMAVNKYGVGEPLESEPVICTNPYVPSDPPQQPEVTTITKDSMVVCWDRPEHDGGSRINTYIIERRDKTGLRWVKCNKRTVSDLRFKVSGLTPGHEYEFRILAENNAGLSQPSAPSPLYKAMDTIFQPGPPGNPRVLDTTKSSITLAWNKPVYDGGSEITGYIVETCLPEEDEWTIHTPKKGWTATSFTITSLRENQEYKINICATNCEGVGEPAAVPGTPKAEDRLLPPEIDLGAELRKVVCIRACSTLRLFVPIKGRPAPEVKWSREHGESLDKANIEVTSSFTTLQVENVDRFDGGKYMVTVENASGSKTAFVNVRVLDTPGAPQNLFIKEVTRDSVSLMWDAPLIDGGSRVRNYIVEKRESTRKFRVIAKNAAGVSSKPSESTGTITAKDEVDPPKIDIEAKYSQPVVVNAGETFKLEANVYGKPVPTVHWMKGNQEITEAARLEIKNTDFTACLVVKEAIRVDGGQYTLLVKNVGGEKTVNINILLEEKLEAPDLDLDAEMRKMISIRAASTLRLFVPVRGRPAPEVKWGKAEGEIKETAQIDNTGTYASLVIENVDRFDSGKYTLTAENASGVKSVFISVRVLDSPSPPANFMVKEITKNSVTLTWEPPLLDGGSKIKHYIVEKRESTRKVYSPVTTCNRMSWKIEPLPEGGIFFFRVLAENEYGVGLPAKTIEPVKISEKPQPPGKVSLIDVTRKTVTLAWEKPVHDGGSRISHYEVELACKDSEAWSVCASVKALETVVTNLQKGEEYQFRVVAVNDKGKSDPRQLAQTVVAKDLVIEPAVRPKTSTYSVQVGYDLKIEVPIAGHPKPTITWTKDGAALKQTTRVNVTDTAQNTTLTIKDATREDGGMYSINIANALGSKDATIEVITLDKPGPPTGPVKLEDISAESITLTWEPPTYTGGCQISNYVVEKRDTTTTNWVVVSATVARTTFKVSNLKTGAEYQFRIYAENRYGKSYAIDSEPVLAQYPFQEPGPPGTPYVSSYTKDYMINKTLIQDCRFKSTPLEEGIDKPSESTGSITAKDEVEPPKCETDARYNQTIVINAGETFILEASVEGKPIPTIQWFKGDVEVENSARAEIK
uniref:Titin n=1 Tax=Myripristis murdjan TaxID=586833 RepID=A0A667WXK0_9TELE